MKTLGVIFVFTLIALSLQQKEVPKEVADFWWKVIEPSKEKCVAETSVDWNLVERMIKFREFPEDKPLKCFVKCTCVNLNYISESGEVNKESLQKLLGEAAEKVIAKCSSPKGDDICDIAHDFGKCLYYTVTESTVGP